MLNKIVQKVADKACFYLSSKFMENAGKVLGYNKNNPNMTGGNKAEMNLW